MKVTLEIQNLKCHGCANTVTTKLSGLDGIENVLVNNDTNSVSFEYNNDATLQEAITLLNSLGYPMVGDKNALTTKAKSFVSCAIGRMNS